MSKGLNSALLAAALAAAVAGPVAAQETPETLNCRFDDGVSRADNRAQRREQDPIELRFSGIDLARGTARLADGQTTRGVAAMGSGHVVTFVEVMSSGNVSMTTVSALPSGDERLAVHSRHVFGSMAPSYVADQYYGRCVAES